MNNPNTISILTNVDKSPNIDKLTNIDKPTNVDKLTNVDKFKCDICGKILSSKKNLMCHIYPLMDFIHIMISINICRKIHLFRLLVWS